MKRFKSLLLVLLSLLILVPSVKAEEVSKSKTATELDDNNTSSITLSLPSDEEKLISDIVFVIDSSSCGGSAWATATEMMTKLSEQIAEKDGALKVGAVVFRGVSFNYELTLTDANSISSVMNEILTRGKEIEKYVRLAENENTLKGSNLHAGLLAADKMLASDKDVDNSRKYVIVITDGITYSWDNNGVQYGVYYQNSDGMSAYPPSNSIYESVKGSLDWAPENNDWGTYFKEHEEAINTLIKEYGIPYDRSTTSDLYTTPSSEVNSVDAALYLSYNAYMNLSNKYHTYAVPLTTGQYGLKFMNFLNGNKSADTVFEDIKYDIYYAVSAGTTVIDEMGYGEDYNFDFINESSAVTLTVGEKTYIPDMTAINEYSFDKTEDGYNYVVNYYAEGDEGIEGEVVEHDYFVWTINTNVSNFTRVSLSYLVQLVSSPTQEGTYTLETNKIATITPVDSNGLVGETEEFEIPTVEFKITSGQGGEEIPGLVQTGSELDYSLMSSVAITLTLMGLVLYTKKRRD